MSLYEPEMIDSIPEDGASIVEQPEKKEEPKYKEPIVAGFGSLSRFFEGRQDSQEQLPSYGGDKLDSNALEVFLASFSSARNQSLGFTAAKSGYFPGFDIKISQDFKYMDVDVDTDWFSELDEGEKLSPKQLKEHGYKATVPMTLKKAIYLADIREEEAALERQLDDFYNDKNFLNGTIPWFLGGMAGELSDPITFAFYAITSPIGGFLGGSIAKKFLKGAGVGAVAGRVALPMVTSELTSTVPDELLRNAMQKHRLDNQEYALVQNIMTEFGAGIGMSLFLKALPGVVPKRFKRTKPDGTVVTESPDPSVMETDNEVKLKGTIQILKKTGTDEEGLPMGQQIEEWKNDVAVASYPEPFLEIGAYTVHLNDGDIASTSTIEGNKKQKKRNIYVLKEHVKDMVPEIEANLPQGSYNIMIVDSVDQIVDIAKTEAIATSGDVVVIKRTHGRTGKVKKTHKVVPTEVVKKKVKDVVFGIDRNKINPPDEGKPLTSPYGESPEAVFEARNQIANKGNEKIIAVEKKAEAAKRKAEEIEAAKKEAKKAEKAAKKGKKGKKGKKEKAKKKEEPKKKETPELTVDEQAINAVKNILDCQKKGGK